MSRRSMTITAVVSLVASTASFAHAVDFTGALAPDQWSVITSHSGITSVTQDSIDTLKCSYNFDGSADPAITGVQAWFGVIADRTGTITFNYQFDGFHSWIGGFAELWVYSEAPGELATQVVPFVPVSGPFGMSGVASLNIVEGYKWGVIAGGRHFDSLYAFNGAVTISNLVPAPGTGVLGAAGMLMTARRRRR